MCPSLLPLLCLLGCIFTSSSYGSPLKRLREDAVEVSIPKVPKSDHCPTPFSTVDFSCLNEHSDLLNEESLVSLRAQMQMETEIQVAPTFQGNAESSIRNVAPESRLNTDFASLNPVQQSSDLSMNPLPEIAEILEDPTFWSQLEQTFSVSGQNDAVIDAIPNVQNMEPSYQPSLSASQFDEIIQLFEQSPLISSQNAQTTQSLDNENQFPPLLTFEPQSIQQTQRIDNGNQFPLFQSFELQNTQQSQILNNVNQFPFSNFQNSNIGSPFFNSQHNPNLFQSQNLPLPFLNGYSNFPIQSHNTQSDVSEPNSRYLLQFLSSFPGQSTLVSSLPARRYTRKSRKPRLQRQKNSLTENESKMENDVGEDDTNVTEKEAESEENETDAGDDFIIPKIVTIQLPEHEPCSLVVSKLRKHQKQGLYWLMLREKDEIGTETVPSDQPLPSLWLEVKSTPSYFLHLALSITQTHRPRPLRGGLIGDEMGLGKTLTMLSLVATTLKDAKVWVNSSLESASVPAALTNNYYTKSYLEVKMSEAGRQLRHQSLLRVKGTLVVVPLALLTTWESEVKKHLKDVSICRFYAKNIVNLKMQSLMDCDIVVTTYDVIVSQFKSLVKVASKEVFEPDELPVLYRLSWYRLVLDESQIIKSPTSIRAGAATHLSASRRWAVSGTPIQNKLADLSSLIRFFHVEYLDSPSSWTQYFGSQRLPIELVGRIQTLMRCIMMRRTKEDVADVIRLPERHDEMKYVNMNKEERLTHRRIFNIGNDEANRLDGVERQRKQFATLFQLRQVSTHLSLVANVSVSENYTSSKVDALIEDLLKYPNEKALVFSQWTTLLDLIQVQLTKRGITSLVLKGSQDVDQREKNIQEFKTNPKVQVFLVSLKLGNAGLTLTEATRAYLMESWWNNSVEEQAFGRIHRIGQTKPVTTIRFIAKASIEEEMLKVKESKDVVSELALAERDAEVLDAPKTISVMEIMEKFAEHDRENREDLSDSESSLEDALN